MPLRQDRNSNLNPKSLRSDRAQRKDRIYIKLIVLSGLRMVNCRDVFKKISLVGRGGGLWTVLFVIAVLLPLPVSYASDEVGLLGDGNDGNRSDNVHLIQLYDKSGATIRAKDEKPEPFSTRRTCGECHNYDIISAGWHFHGGDTADDAGRKGEPLIIYDSGTRTVLPVSSRGWQGSFTPEQLGRPGLETQGRWNLRRPALRGSRTALRQNSMRFD